MSAPSLKRTRSTSDDAKVGSTAVPNDKVEAKKARKAKEHAEKEEARKEEAKKEEDNDDKESDDNDDKESDDDEESDDDDDEEEEEEEDYFDMKIPDGSLNSYMVNASTALNKAIQKADDIATKSKEPEAKKRKVEETLKDKGCGSSYCRRMILETDAPYLHAAGLCEHCFYSFVCEVCEESFDPTVPGRNMICGHCVNIKETVKDRSFPKVWNNLAKGIASAMDNVVTETPEAAGTVATIMRGLLFSRHMQFCRSCKYLKEREWGSFCEECREKSKPSNRASADPMRVSDDDEGESDSDEESDSDKESEPEESEPKKAEPKSEKD
jgi:hypothetical protein